MQCSGCGYISFKKEKACGACGFKFKKSAQSAASLARKESFSIFAGSAKEQGQNEDPSAMESVGLLEDQESVSFIDPETGDFNLDLPETSNETIEKTQVSSNAETPEFEPLDFDLNADIELEEVEGLGLEPLHVAEPKADAPEPANVSLESADSIEETKIEEEIDAVAEPVLEIGEPEQEPALSIEPEMDEPAISFEPALEIGEPESEDVISPALEIGEPESEDVISLEPVLEIGEPESEETASAESVLEIGEPDAVAPELDLGENEIALDLDGSTATPEPTPPAAAPLDDIELNLEIDDSDGPLTIQSPDIPDIEIEDLGLELESPDDPDPKKP